MYSTPRADQKHDVRFTRFHIDAANNNLIAVFNQGFPCEKRIFLLDHRTYNKVEKEKHEIAVPCFPQIHCRDFLSDEEEESLEACQRSASSKQWLLAIELRQSTTI